MPVHDGDVRGGDVRGGDVRGSAPPVDGDGDGDGERDPAVPGSGSLLLVVPARDEQPGVVRRTLLAWLAAQGVAPALGEDIVLAVDEGMANSIEHGYRDLPPGAVRVSAELLPGCVRVEVSDDGRWHEPGAVASAHRGRGLGMMRALSSAMSVGTGAGTTVSLAFTLRGCDR